MRLNYALVLAVPLILTSQSATAGECNGFEPQPWWCFEHILCEEYQQYWDVRRSVVQIYGPDIEASGVLINNASCSSHDEQCETPYLLTALHNISGQIGEAPSAGEIFAIENETTFSFGYESPFCDGGIPADVVGISGSTVLVYDVQKDLALLQLSTKAPPAVAPYFVGWTAQQTNTDHAVAITHPCGGPKRISIALPFTTTYFEAVGVNWFRVQYWQHGEIAGGSSGGPLLDADGDLLGVMSQNFGSGPEFTCEDPSLETDDAFVAITSITDFLPNFVDGGLGTMMPHDGDPDAVPSLLKVSSDYFAPGDVAVISAGVEVRLVDGFHADSGSAIVVKIEP